MGSNEVVRLRGDNSGVLEINLWRDEKADDPKREKPVYYLYLR